MDVGEVVGHGGPGGIVDLGSDDPEEPAVGRPGGRSSRDKDPKE